MISNLLPFLNALQDIAVIITLVIVAYQVILFVRQNKQNAIISYYQYYKDVDIVLLQNEEKTRKVLGESKEDTMAYLAFLTFSLTFQLHEERLTDQRWWRTDEATIIEALKQERLRLHWKQFKHIYNQDFARFVERKLQDLDREKQLSSDDSDHPST